MAGATGISLSPPIKRLVAAPKSAILALFRSKVSAGVPFKVRFSADCHSRRLSTCSAREPQRPVVPEGPSCIFVGPIETASQETLEALYSQARDAYNSGVPLIVDDMFDRVKLKLRTYGSKYVVKYPRCSLRRQSAYADAQEEPLLMFILGSIWSLTLVFGGSACLVPMLYTISLAYQDAFNTATLDSSQSTTMGFLGMLTCALFMLLGSVIGCPIASASARGLQGLWKNDLVAVKGACPNCGEEVFAFVRPEKGNGSPHRANCHVCDCVLEFRTKAEPSFPQLGRRWVHGHVYLISERRNCQSQLRT